MPELNPCPHCAKLPIIELAAAINGKYVLTHKCLDGGFYIEMSDDFETPEKAVEKWNEIFLDYNNSQSALLREHFVKQMMKRGLSTGHGNTLTELHAELWWQLDEIKPGILTAK